MKILAYDYGQYNSMKANSSIDNKGNDIPWYTYPSIEYLNNLDFSDKLIFEYGSGASSSYWSSRCKKIVSIEHDKNWFNKVNKKLENNQALRFKKDDIEYEDSVNKENIKFDVIIIDGIRRTKCSKCIVKSLNKESKDGYMIILDNADWYKEIAKYFKEELNLIEIDFHGFTPINNYTSTTSIFISRNFNFQPINNSQPNFSISGLEQSRV